MTIGSDVRVHLRRHRQQRDGMTQQVLADLAGVSRQTIHSIETGKYKPSIELALRLARLFDVPVEELFELSGEEDGR